jgi:VanZ family protein
MKNWIWRWGPAILVMSIIFLASSTPKSELPDFGLWDAFAKKGGHMAGYALLAAAFFHALSKNRTMGQSPFFLAAVFAVLYAISDEWHQKFIPGRSASVWDVAIDAAGIILGLAFLRAIRAHSPFTR